MISSGVGGVAAEEIEGVRKERKHGLERAFGSGGVAGKIDDEAGADCAADASAECGEGGVERPVAADVLSEAGDEAIADGESCFGGDVARRETGASGGDDERVVGGGCAEGGGDLCGLVGDESCGGGGALLGEDTDESRTGKVGLGAGVAAVADGNDGGVSAGKGTHAGKDNACSDRRQRGAENEKIEEAEGWGGKARAG